MNRRGQASAPGNPTVADSTAAKKRILIIEDDAAIAEVLTYNLEREGYEIVCHADGKHGLKAALEKPADLIVLDLMLPGMDGVEICRRLRAEAVTRMRPILMLTAKAEEIDQVVGFSVGADDYVTKPFSVKVLLQRIKVLLTRRQPAAGEADTLSMHGIVLDRTAHRVSVNDRELPLTPTEFRILETLLAQTGRAFSRTDLLTSAVGDETIVLERTIDVHIRSLRSKLDDLAWTIETVRGIGYRIAREKK